MSSILQDETKTAMLAYILIKRKYSDARNFSQTDTGLIRMCGSTKLNKLWIELINVPRDRLLSRKDLLNLFYIQYYKEWPAMVYKFFKNENNLECVSIWCYLLLEPHLNGSGINEVAQSLNASTEIVQFYNWKQSLDNSTIIDADRQTAARLMTSLLNGSRLGKLMEYEQSALVGMPLHLSLLEYLQFACWILYVDKFFQDFYDQNTNWFDVPLRPLPGPGAPAPPPPPSGTPAGGTPAISVPGTVGTSAPVAAGAPAGAAAPASAVAGAPVRLAGMAQLRTRRTATLINAALAFRDAGANAASGAYRATTGFFGGVGRLSYAAGASAVAHLGHVLSRGGGQNDEMDDIAARSAAEEVLEEAVAEYDAAAAYHDLWDPPPAPGSAGGAPAPAPGGFPAFTGRQSAFPQYPTAGGAVAVPPAAGGPAAVSPAAGGPAASISAAGRRPVLALPRSNLSWLRAAPSATGVKPAGQSLTYRPPPPLRPLVDPRAPPPRPFLDPDAHPPPAAGSPRATGLLPHIVDPTGTFDPADHQPDPVPYRTIYPTEQLSLETTLDNVSGHVEDSSDVGIGKVVLDVVDCEAEIDPSLQGEPHQPHGFGCESNVLELGICQSHGLELPGSGFQSNDVSEIPVKVMDGMGGPIDEVDSVPGLATSMEHPHANVGLNALELLGGDLPPQDSVEIDKLIVFNISPVQSGFELVSPAMDAGALGGCESNEHCVEEKNLYDHPQISLRNQCIHDGVYNLKITHRMDAGLEKL